MSDKKDKQNADLEANLAKIANTKPRLRNRKHDIYERYISRVESLETIESAIESIENTENLRVPTVTNNDTYDETDAGLSASILDRPVQQPILQPLKNADKLSSYEPLSAVELELFAIQEQDSVENIAGLQVSDNMSISVSLDFSDKEDEKVVRPLTITEATDSAASTDKNENTEVDNSDYIDEPISTASLQKQKSSKKPLIIG
ncbi:MAG TPA: hypothetical protein VLN09_04145, partial [Psychrobacter sp.]|nr:hypothetical protein [Psychrobacter sp.]